MLRIISLIVILCGNGFALSETFQERQERLEELLKQKRVTQGRANTSVKGLPTRENELKKQSDRADLEELRTTEEEKNAEPISAPLNTIGQVFPPLLQIMSVEPDLIPTSTIHNLQVFGQELFSKSSRYYAMQTLQPQDVPDSYSFGAGDTLSIHVWNQTQDETFLAEVSSEGNIPFPLAGEIAVAGISKKELVPYLQNKLQGFYKDLKISYQIVKLRQFPLYVTGEVKNPGMYLANALSTPIQLLSAAGGPKVNGSLRKIRILRNSEVLQIVDLQKFLTEGILEGSQKLHSQDVIHVPLIQQRLAVIGRVKRPGIYEIHDEPDMSKVLELSGGLEPDADPKSLKWFSFQKNGTVTMRDLNEVSLVNQAPQDGGVLLAGSTKNTIKNKIAINGNVFAPGVYEWAQKLTLKQLIAKAQGIKPKTHLGTAEIKRLMDKPETVPHHQGMLLRTQYQTLHVNLGQEISGKISTPLHPLDEIRIFSLNEMQVQPHIEISGEVARPGSVELQKNTRVRDVLVKAQLKDSAHLLSGELSRQTKDGIQTLRFSVGQALAGEDEHNLFLQHLDSITVFKDPRLAKQGTIVIGGQVLYPGEYRFNTGAKLSDLLMRAGGLSEGAFLMGAKLYRKNLAMRQKEIRDSFVAREQENLNNLKIKASQMAGEESAQDKKATLESLEQVDDTLEKLSSIEIEGRLALDFRNINSIEDIKNSINDIVLEDGDRFEIPTKPSEVTIAGQVYAPSTMLHRDGLTVRDYIQAAGGFNDNAYTSKVFVIKANGQAVPVSQIRNKTLRYVEPVRTQEETGIPGIAQLIEAGDTIIVPTRIQIRRNQFKESLDSIYKMAITVGALGNIF